MVLEQYYKTLRGTWSICTVYRQKELFRRRDHNLLGSRYGVFRCGEETTQVQDSGKVDMSSQRQLVVAVTVQDMYRSSCVETVEQAQDWSGAIYVVRGNVILMGWSRMCLWMFMDKQAVGVQLGEVVVQGCVDGQELVQEHQDTWCN